MFADEASRGEPVKGKRYMWLSILMMIFLSAIVLADAKHTNLKTLAANHMKYVN